MTTLRHFSLTDAPPPAAPAARVAFASSDRRHVDQHFGAATGFTIHWVSQRGSQIAEVIELAADNGAEDKLAERLEALRGCAAVYCQAAGAGAISRLLARDIQPRRAEPGTPITAVLADLVAQLPHRPEVWLARALRTPAEERARFDALEAEGWTGSAG
ncbi:NifB/NifX family molybdenum-iron cluster-binding protein [Halorhodospira neutriphila]|uniref:Dinitrogenase iron-molybdenum cofactor biosynthesis domain-containing protein n=1 Tax=Halorhodospira neutriphila TaxID=168379 RepID=A0ABS1E4Q8_9GAMM|nr:NifB/NifX family molybdenum-iron cluster-binding protein [Halorhodospira neutriphila]MBK1726488.1 hypothetical protein [Halorhodospira neutriphila]